MAWDLGDIKSIATVNGGNVTTISAAGTATTWTDIANGKTGSAASGDGGSIRSRRTRAMFRRQDQEICGVAGAGEVPPQRRKGGAQFRSGLHGVSVCKVFLTGRHKWHHASRAMA
jgi:hypothetical protein